MQSQFPADNARRIHRGQYQTDPGEHAFDYDSHSAAMSAMLVAVTLTVQLSSWAWVSGNNRSTT